MMALAQAPASSGTLSGQVVDAAGRPAGVEVLLSALGRAPGVDRCSRGRSPIARDGSGSTFPPKRIPGGPFSRWRSGPTPRRRGLAGQAFSPSALPAAGSVQLKLGGPGAHGGSRGGTRWKAGGRRAGSAGVGACGRRGPAQVDVSRCPTRSPTCSRPRPTPTARGKSRAVEPRTSRRSWSKPPGSVSREASSARVPAASGRSHSRPPAG